MQNKDNVNIVMRLTVPPSMALSIINENISKELPHAIKVFLSGDYGLGRNQFIGFVENNTFRIQQQRNKDGKLIPKDWLIDPELCGKIEADGDGSMIVANLSFGPEFKTIFIISLVFSGIVAIFTIFSIAMTIQSGLRVESVIDLERANDVFWEVFKLLCFLLIFLSIPIMIFLRTRQAKFQANMLIGFIDKLFFEYKMKT